jgi:hypothetical protein
MDLKGAGWEAVMWIHLVRNRILRGSYPFYDQCWLIRSALIRISKRKKKHELLGVTPRNFLLKCYPVGRIKPRNFNTQLENFIFVKSPAENTNCWLLIETFPTRKICTV